MLTKTKHVFKSFGPYFVPYSWKVPDTKEVHLYSDWRGKGHDDCERTNTLQTHERGSPGRTGWCVFEFASSFNFTYLLSARELQLFFVLLHTPSFSLGFLMFVSFHQSSSDAFMQTHSPLSSQCLSLSAASTLIQYGLQALDTAQLPDSDEHILISYKSSPHREEAVQTQERKRHCK